MKRNRLAAAALALLIALLAVLPQPAWAIRAEIQPPAITVLVMNAPSDLTLTLHMDRKGEDIPVPLFHRTKGWETYYQFYREEVWEVPLWYGNNHDLKDSYIVASSGGVEKRIAVPPEALSADRDDYMTLNWKEGVITAGMPAWRAPLLFAVRILVGLLLEGVIFFLYGYRKGTSWLAFLLVNLVTLGVFSYMVIGWLNARDLSIIPLILVTIFLLLVEIVAMLIAVSEQSRNRTASFVVVANAASITAEILILTYLPV